MKQYILKGIKWWWYRFRVTKIWRVYTLVPPMILFITISKGDFNIWFYIGCLFGIYPMSLFLILLIYAWILNPIRETFPNSIITKKVIEKIDGILR